MAKVIEVRLVGLIPVATAPETMLTPKELMLMAAEWSYICALLEAIFMLTEEKSAFSSFLTVLSPKELMLIEAMFELMFCEFRAMRAYKLAMLLEPEIPVIALRDWIARIFATALLWFVTT